MGNAKESTMPMLCIYGFVLSATPEEVRVHQAAPFEGGVYQKYAKPNVLVPSKLYDPKKRL